MSKTTPPHSLSTQPVKADGRPPRARFCSRFLPVKGEFFLAAVAKCLLTGECWVFVRHIIYSSDISPTHLYWTLLQDQSHHFSLHSIHGHRSSQTCHRCTVQISKIPYLLNAILIIWRFLGVCRLPGRCGRSPISFPTTQLVTRRTTHINCSFNKSLKRIC